MKFQHKKFTCTSATPYNRYKPGVWSHPSTDRFGNCMVCGTRVLLIIEERVHHGSSVPNLQSVRKSSNFMQQADEAMRLMEIQARELEKKYPQGKWFGDEFFVDASALELRLMHSFAMPAEALVKELSDPEDPTLRSKRKANEFREVYGGRIHNPKAEKMDYDPSVPMDEDGDPIRCHCCGAYGSSFCEDCRKLP